jgi:tight adherence protein B
MSPYTPYVMVALIVGAVLLLHRTVALVLWAVRRTRRSPEEPAPPEDGQLVVNWGVLNPPKGVDGWFERLVKRTGWELSPAQALGWMALAGVASGGGLLLWRDNLVLAGAGLVAAMLLVLGVLLFQRARWVRRLQEQLPDALFLLSRSLRAGLTVEQAFELIGAQGARPLSEEFRRCAEHLRLGLTVPASLQLTADRVDLPDFNLFVSMLTVHRRTGGNLPALLDRLAASVRDRNQFRGHVRAVTALGRISGLCVALASPLLLLLYWALNPEFLSRFTDSPQGLTALGVAVTLETIGVVWLLWLFRVDY